MSVGDQPDRVDPDRTRRFAVLWVGSQATLSAYVYGIVRDPHDAEDVLARVAESAVEHFDEYDPARSFTGWTLGIARHRVLHYLRTKKRDRHVFSSGALEAIESACRTLHDTQDDRRAALAQCVRRLSSDHRKLIELRYRDDLRPVTIAAHVGGSGLAVRQKLHRIRQTLAECIRRRLAGEVDDA